MLRRLNDLRIVAKLIIPLAAVFLSLGVIVWTARDGVTTLGATSHALVEGAATRLRLALEIGLRVNEATVAEKNLIIEADAARMAQYEAAYHRAIDQAREGAQRLLALSTRADLRADSTRILEGIDAYDAVTNRSVAHGLRNEAQAAQEISANAGREARLRLVALVEKRAAWAADSMRAEMAEADRLSASALRTLYVTAALGLLAAIGLLLWVGIALIARPLGAMVESMTRIAGGDLTVAVTGSERRDEVGALARALEVFKTNGVEMRRLAEEQEAIKQQAEQERRASLLGMAEGFERSVGGIVGTVASASTELEQTARSMSATARRTSEQAREAGAGAGTASESVQTVAAAAEQLSASIAEISRQVAHSTEVTHQAVDEANRSNASVAALSQSAERIGDVVQMISSIAAQTNLLALNATIEAARAGDAGKGFAVVASEVKQLAGQTAHATVEIGKQIAEMRHATTEAVGAIQGIGTTITKVGEIATAIAAAVEEQGTATRDIAGNVQRAAEGTLRATGSAGETERAAADTGAASAQVLTAAGELSRMAESLQAEMRQFLTTVRAA
ncbi:methyl-accepting chemotaxis protein [Roseicella aquatilis]|uniref:HAMP domain-containing protein n=1 Tax=Roseicella aquatilis TaxID=2527868 RepID=A0A4R4D570_9PROT|nr:methyl-accepting chemotaxis protein [Roseicella aquatilis]TCZ53920.1 HAMP domain-containing protein [Roseicella aquatilis]